jgi:hypothetical protein
MRLSIRENTDLFGFAAKQIALTRNISFVANTLVEVEEIFGAIIPPFFDVLTPRRSAVSHRFVLLLSVVSCCVSVLAIEHPTTNAFPVSPAATTRFYDGPAQLPIATVSSSMSSTPAPGSVITVRAGDDLQSALDSAQCGDTVQLQAGAVFTGTFRLRARDCDNSRWIIVRTSSPGALPPEGRRLTPCYAGVASLPGRPSYACDKRQNVLAKIVASRSNAVLFEIGANHYRLMGLEITRQKATKGAVTLIAVERGQGPVDHIVLDRSWLHGTSADETKVGFRLSGTSYVAVVDSYFSDFHCTSVSGSCTEAHALGGGVGNYQDGPYKIQNNFLESSGQAILFGGGPATTTPRDITIRFNHFFKPWLWMKGHLPYQGGVSGDPFIVNHHLELKNAKRVLIENNLMENVWGGFTESGDAILLTPRNQLDLCPICAVTDITIRYTHIIHAAGGIVIGTNLSGNGDGGPAQAGTRFSIHDIVMDDISRRYLGGGRLFVVTNGWPTNPVNTITINHITGFADPEGGILSVGNQNSNPEMYGFVFTNSIVRSGRYPVWNAGGEKSCAYSGTPAQKIANCFATHTFKENVLVGAPSTYPASSWPTDNWFATDMNSVGFVLSRSGNGGNYELDWASPYKNMGTDGKDLGANIIGLSEALAGVE